MNENEIMESAEFEDDIAQYLLDDDETANQPKADQPAAATEIEQTPENNAQEPPEGEAQPAGEGETAPEPPASEETFELKYMDTVRPVKREELISLAQQGLDYGRVRQQREQLTTENQELRRFRDEHAEAIELLTNLAKENGRSLSEYVEGVQIGNLMKHGLTEDAARDRIARERAEKRLNEMLQKEDAAKAVDEKTRRANEDIQRFVQTHPEVKPNEVPPEVWERVNRGESLLTAYDAVKNEQALQGAAAEIERLKGELEALKQNQKNRQTAIGSQSSNGGDRTVDPFIAALMADD